MERTWVSEERSRFLALRLQEKELNQREQVLFQLKYIHDGVVQLSQHHKVDRKAGSTVLGGWIAREPRQGVVLLQNKSARENRGSGRGRDRLGVVRPTNTFYSFPIL